MANNNNDDDTAYSSDALTRQHVMQSFEQMINNNNNSNRRRRRRRGGGGGDRQQGEVVASEDDDDDDETEEFITTTAEPMRTAGRVRGEIGGEPRIVKRTTTTGGVDDDDDRSHRRRRRRGGGGDEEDAGRRRRSGREEEDDGVGATARRRDDVYDASIRAEMNRMQKIMERQRLITLLSQHADYPFLVLVAGKLNREVVDLFDPAQLDILQDVYRSQARINSLESWRMQSEREAVTASVASAAAAAASPVGGGGGGGPLLDLLPSIDELAAVTVRDDDDTKRTRVINLGKMLHTHVAVKNGWLSDYVKQNYAVDAARLADLDAAAWAHHWLLAHDAVVEEHNKAFYSQSQATTAQPTTGGHLYAVAYNALRLLMQYTFEYLLEAHTVPWYVLLGEVVPQLPLIGGARESRNGVDVLVELLAVYETDLNVLRLRTDERVQMALLAYLRAIRENPPPPRADDDGSRWVPDASTVWPHEVAAFVHGAPLELPESNQQRLGADVILRYLKEEDNRIRGLRRGVDDEFSRGKRLLDELYALFANTSASLPRFLRELVGTATATTSAVSKYRMDRVLLPLFTLDLNMRYRRAKRVFTENAEVLLADMIKQRKEELKLDYRMNVAEVNAGDFEAQRNWLILKLDDTRLHIQTPPGKQESEVDWRDLFHATELDIDALGMNVRGMPRPDFFAEVLFPRRDFSQLYARMEDAYRAGEAVHPDRWQQQSLLTRLARLFFSVVLNPATSLKLDVLTKFAVFRLIDELLPVAEANNPAAAAAAPSLTVEERRILGDSGELRKTALVVAAESRAAALVMERCPLVNDAMREVRRVLPVDARIDLLASLKRSERTRQAFAHLVASVYTGAELQNPNQYYPEKTHRIQRQNIANALLELNGMKLRARAVNPNNNNNPQILLE